MSASDPLKVEEKSDPNDQHLSGTGDIFQIETYYPIFISKWNKEPGMCSICRNLVEGPCISCQSLSENTVECFMRWGACGHAFHDHCIKRWLNSRNVCPLDNKPWRTLEEWSDVNHEQIYREKLINEEQESE